MIIFRIIEAAIIFAVVAFPAMVVYALIEEVKEERLVKRAEARSRAQKLTESIIRDLRNTQKSK